MPRNSKRNATCRDEEQTCEQMDPLTTHPERAEIRAATHLPP